MKELRKSLKKGLPLTIFLIFLLGCVDDFERFTPYPPEGDIESFYTKVQTLSEIYSVDAEQGGNIITDHRTILTIPASAFMYPDGAIATGAVEIDFLEIYDKGLMIMYNKPTVSNGRLLESDGVFNISATQNGQNLLIRKGYDLRLRVPNEEPNNAMQLFYGGEENIENVDGFNWTPVNRDGSTANTIGINEWAWQDSLDNWFDFGYEFFTDSLTWINIDVFKDIPEDQKTDVCVELPEIYTNTNTVTFMVFRDFDSVVSLYGDSESKLFCEPYGLTPIGFNVTFVVISSQGDDTYHFGIADATIVKDHLEYIVPEPKTIEEILDILGMF